MPPIPPVKISQLVDHKAQDGGKEKAREVWSSHRSHTESNDTANPLSSVATMDTVLDDLNARAREKIVQLTATFRDTSERQAASNALQHANNTILKCINPLATFKQLRQKPTPEFFSPAKKREILSQVTERSKDVKHEVTGQQKKLHIAKEQVQ